MIEHLLRIRTLIKIELHKLREETEEAKSHKNKTSGTESEMYMTQLTRKPPKKTSTHEWVET